MAKLKLTDAVVRSATLPEGRTDLILWDTELTGFGLRVRPGSKTFVLTYRPAGAGRSTSSIKLKLGPVARFETTAEARRAARIEAGKISAGVNPAAERRAKRLTVDTTLSVVLDRYAADLERRGIVNARHILKELRTRLAPHLKSDIRDLKGATLAAIGEKLEAAGKAGAAKGWRERVKAFFTFAVTKAHVLDVHPLAGHRKERASRQDRIAKKPAGRALSDAELAKVWSAADPSTSFGALLRFLVLTGCRRGEGAQLRRSMRQGDALVLPAMLTKQGRPHTVAITPQLGELLDDPADGDRTGRPPIVAADPDLFFPSLRSGGPIAGWSKLVPAFVKRSGVDFELHDLRRTFRTGLSRLGIDAEVAELATGHKREDLTETYEKDRRAAEVRKAFEIWAAHVAHITSESHALV